ncbi:hypothetical protein H6P81_018156 [Aristolochia fimbriata]|uniref:F-box domain-containing protein n=1 Tax=Aristolochia fimbriata TaxID=158543 RepID=A0AAV7E4H2_ARIFI|nr:hypothetical protein H6P81_018156 [Aristolochia fimbriata]
MSLEKISHHEDILFEVLARLPKKTQTRFRATSKKWESLIKAAVSSKTAAKSLYSGFVWSRYYGEENQKQQEFYRLTDTKGGFALQHSRSFLFSSMSTATDVGSCNGVLFYGHGVYGRKNYTYSLYNPFTKQISILPPHYDFKMSHYEYPTGLGLVFDPNCTHNHYKFVVVYWCNYDHLHKSPSHGLTVSIFSSKTGRWETKQAKLDTATYQYLETSVHDWGASALHFKGNLYWALPLPACMVVFCMETGTFEAFELPHPSEDEMMMGVLWESEGKIFYCQICFGDGFCIWVFDEDRGNEDDDLPWRRTYYIDSDTMFSMLEGVCEEESRKKGAFFYRVTSFNEHLQIAHLETTEGLVRFDVAEKRMTLIGSSTCLKEVGITYGGVVLPEYPAPVMPSSSSSKKRKFRYHYW